MIKAESLLAEPIKEQAHYIAFGAAFGKS